MRRGYAPHTTDGTFEPRFIPKHERRSTGSDDRILALYARGMTVREIQGFLADMYAVEVSPDLIRTVTDGIVAEVTAWQSRPLERMYPVVFFDALRVKIRDEATVRSKAIYLALAVLPDGHRDILGLWIEQTEGAKFWMKVFSDLKTRGCQDILIAVTEKNQVVFGSRDIGVSGVRALIKRLTTQEPEMPVIIQADEGSQTGTLVRVVDEAKLGGARTVNVATRK